MSRKRLCSKVKAKRANTKSNQQLLQEKVEGQIGAVAMLVPGIEEVETMVSINDQGGMENRNDYFTNLLIHSLVDSKIGVLGLNYQSLSAEEKKRWKRKYDAW